ncbi:hypothetical protein QQ045_001696 [Rhodiola kirilowii]
MAVATQSVTGNMHQHQLPSQMRGVGPASQGQGCVTHMTMPTQMQYVQHGQWDSETSILVNHHSHTLGLNAQMSMISYPWCKVSLLGLYSTSSYRHLFATSQHSSS